MIGKEINRAGDLFGLADFAAYGLARQVIQAFLHVALTDMSASQARSEHRRIHSARQDGIDADVIRRELNRHGTRQGE